MNINRDILGKLFFAVGILIGIYMLFCPISNILIHVDEYWTLSLINLPFIKGMRIAACDVHPPLHYIILYILSPLTHNSIHLLKITSIVPYFILLAVSATKIRKDYGWLTSGVFAFTIATMSVFFLEFLTVRMYPWFILFTVLAFIYMKEVIENFDRKSWILLTLFTLLASYTHYFALFTCGLMYLLILADILKSQDKKEKIKTWAYSVISLMILYAPWFYILIRQIGTQASSSHGDTVVTSAFNYLTFFAVNSLEDTPEIMALRIVAIVFVAIVLVLIYKKRAKYEASGVFLMYATVLVGFLIISFTVQPLRVRYLAAGFAIFWLCVSTLLTKIESDKILAVLLAFIIVMSASSVILTHEEAVSKIGWDEKRADFLESIDNESNVVVYNTNFGYMFTHTGLKNTTQYSLSDTYFFDDDVKIEKNLDKILDKHKNNDVYLINWKDTTKNSKYEKLNLTEKYDSGDVEVFKIN